MNTVVKICGVRTAEQALCAAEAGADLIGLVFYPPSHRCVTPDEARAVVAALHEAGARTGAVGLFVNEAPARINALAAEIGLAMVQLSGDEPASDLGEIALPLLRTVRLSLDGDAGQVRERLARERMTSGGGDAGPLGQRLTFLVDAHVPGIYGGTGTRADWALAAEIAREAPVLLAGGLSPDNVADAVRAVRPLGVDVSSGVETGRAKDLRKIRRFVAAAREADERLARWAEPVALEARLT